MKLPPFFFVFDVESVGLHGEPFAVGWVVIDAATGDELEHDLLASSAEAAALCRTPVGTARPEDILWVADNVLPALAGVELIDRGHIRGPNIRKPFWLAWKSWEERGALLAADVAWPVEARFLMQCARYTIWPLGPNHQTESGPYPLIDIASIRLAKGLDPLANESRFPNELPAHNPLNDARQSARLLMEALAL